MAVNQDTIDQVDASASADSASVYTDLQLANLLTAIKAAQIRTYTEAGNKRVGVVLSELRSLLTANVTGASGYEIYNEKSVDLLLLLIAALRDDVSTLDTNLTNVKDIHAGNGAPPVSLGTDGDTYIDTGTGNLYSKAAGTWSATGDSLAGPQGEQGLSGALTDGDYGDIVVSANGATLTIDNDAVTAGKIAASAVTLAKLADIANMKILGNVSGSSAAPAEISVLDEDTMSSDSATGIPTQQSVKAYVDNSIDSSSTTWTWLSSQSTSSGTAKNFTGLAGAREIIVIGDDVSLSTTEAILVQLGDEGGIEVSGYRSGVEHASAGQYHSTAGFNAWSNNSGSMSFVFRLTNPTGNYWSSEVHGLRNSDNHVFHGFGVKTLTGALTQLTVTSAASVNFDDGTLHVGWKS